jgi:hypothetical protein
MAIASTMLALGTRAPDFDLIDVVSGEHIVRSELEGRPLLVMFLCSHCPYVKHVEQGLGKLGTDYAGSDVAIVGLCSNDAQSHPEDGPDGMRAQVARAAWTFPYARDDSQDVARAYTAACTPDAFVFDREHRLAYRGQLDGSRPGNGVEVTCEDLRAAMEAVLAGERPQAEQRPSIGCGIKWTSRD